MTGRMHERATWGHNGTLAVVACSASSWLKGRGSPP